MKNVFDKAMEAAPSIVLLDDMDKFANEDYTRSDAEEYVTIQSCIDAIKTEGKEVFVFATANNTRKLPNSLIRAGRFDMQANKIIFLIKLKSLFIMIIHCWKSFFRIFFRKAQKSYADKIRKSLENSMFSRLFLV